MRKQHAVQTIGSRHPAGAGKTVRIELIERHEAAGENPLYLERPLPPIQAERRGVVLS